MENELKAAVQINPNGFPPAFTLLRVPSTGIMMINEKCFAPLHKALMQSGMNFCFFSFFFFSLFVVIVERKRKREEIVDGKAIGSWFHAWPFAHSPGWRLPEGQCSAHCTRHTACCLPSLHCKGLASLNFPCLNDL